ncbi:MAG: hypothetical protein WA227_13280, partial [Mycobacterium sp.]
MQSQLADVSPFLSLTDSGEPRSMSHHFDTPTGREDPRLNLCDFYLFAGDPGKTTAMAMTVNPAATAET